MARTKRQPIAGAMSPSLRMQGVAAVTRALDLPAHHVVRARELIAAMQPVPGGAR